LLAPLLSMPVIPAVYLLMRQEELTGAIGRFRRRRCSSGLAKPGLGFFVRLMGFGVCFVQLLLKPRLLIVNQLLVAIDV
jgi:hypothetical protein